ncbi:Uu.00g109620.m01.CDS01 [Anthostomella pinea]|uniref:Uu.00g109620.m01.CDS01 n=1 Tax=Anthostomella pinea TaxID=933095 RepID=A0AAI8YG66_9PEZI|nr:Uu.00g109620.m01.CDS01 [Anthostomella pinea]
MSDFRFSDSNFGEPEPVSNRPETIYGLVISFMILSWAAVLLRLYVRFKIVRAPGWDDLCVVMYLLTTTAGSIAICISTKYYGLGQHFLLLTQAQWLGYLKTFYVANAAYVVSTAFIKLALLLQYRRVFERGYVMHRLITGLTVFTALWGLAYSFIAWFPCFPVWELWIADPGAHCYGYGSKTPGPFVATYESHSGINMVLDIIVLLIPLPLFFKESATFATRMRLVALLSMGTLVIVLASWRLASIVEHQVTWWPTPDPTWYGPIIYLLAVLEVDAAAVCASVPIFWPVLTVQWGKIFVTQEVAITHETRYGYDDHHNHDDEDGLRRGTTHSRTGSELEIISGKGSRLNDPGHYQDSYILSQVDPLRSPSTRVQTSARSDGIRGGSRKWIKI